MKNLFLVLFSFGFFCATAQTFEQSFNNYLIGEKEQILRRINDQVVLEQNLKVLDNLLKIPVLQSSEDVALLYALDNVCNEIEVSIDTTAGADTVTHFIIYLGLRGSEEWFIHTSLKNKSGSGLATPSSNIQIVFGPDVTAYEIDILPKRTDNMETDNTVYLNRIKELITIHRDKLTPDGITFESYMVYEKQKKLATTVECLSFRSSFIRYMYAKYDLPLR
jgi:hypothetical protein